MKTTTTLRNLITAVVCLVSGLQAQAQFNGSLDFYPATDWGNEKTISFNLTDVATQLATTPADLTAAFESWTAEGSTDADLFFLTVGDALSSEYTQGGKGGFWVNAEGAPQAWSDDNSALRWFNTIGVDVEADAFDITIGQYPEACHVGDVFTPKFVLKVGDHEATFDVTVTIVEKPSYDIPEPQLLWKNLTIVDELTIDTELKLDRTGNTEVNLTEAIAKLGISADLLADELPNLLYATRYYLTDDVALGGMKHDSLTNQSTAYAPGFWLRRVNAADGTETNECSATAWGGDDHFYLQLFKFDAATGLLTSEIGQMASNLTEGEQYYTYLYIVYGDKAISLRYNLNVIETQLGTLEDYEKAGETTVELEMPAMDSYNTKSFKVDIETIAQTLGCDVADIEFWACRDDVNFSAKNQEGVGYWFNGDDYVVDWGDYAKVFITPQADDLSKFGLGQYPGHLQTGDELNASLYFLGNGRYYKLTVHLKVVEATVIDGEFESVAQRSYVIEQEPAEYVWSEAIAIPEAWLEETLGTSDWVVYGPAALNEDGTPKAGNEKYTANYTCTPNPGFWLSADGCNNGWNANARIGITAAAPDGGGIAMMQYEGGVCNIGDTFKTQLFFVNESTGKMVTLNFTYNIVAEVIQAEVVGTEDIVLPISTDDMYVGIDLTKAAEALGVSVADLVADENEWMHGMTEAGTFGEGRSCYYGLGFRLDGFCDNIESNILFNIEAADGQPQLAIYSIEDVADDFVTTGQFCFQVGEKRYIFNVRFVAASVFTGIDDVKAKGAATTAIYDLSGHQVKQPSRGLYIVGGKKVLVK